MNTKKNSFTKLLSFAIIAVLLVCIITFAVSGWQEKPNDENSGESGETTDNTDNDNNEEVPPQNSEVIPPPPTYISAMTGLEITEEEYNASPLAVLVNAGSSVYGLSGADLCIEFPTEKNQNRLLFYTTKSATLWKAGPIAQSREYINRIISIFGIPAVHTSSDDIVDYGRVDITTLSLNLSAFSDCYYKELYNVYTTSSLINLLIERLEISGTCAYVKTPFSFSEDKVIGTTDAKTVMIPYSAANETEFYYSETSGKYSYYKSGNKVTDMLTGAGVEFENLFILFTDTATHETASGAELVVNTTGGGRGYYISEGKKTEILWSVDENQNYKFTTLDGNILSVNKGSSYITYYKSFLSENIVTK